MKYNVVIWNKILKKRLLKITVILPTLLLTYNSSLENEYIIKIDAMY